MVTEIDLIAKQIMAGTSKLTPQDHERLADVLTQVLALIDSTIRVVNDEGQTIKEIADQVIDEVFVDFHVALTLATAGQIKSACVLLRVCIESLAYVIFFVDHPVEGRIWANADQDMSFNETCSTMCRPEYLAAASGRAAPSPQQVEAILLELRDVYRLLSERVHGKYKFLQVSSPDARQRLRDFISLVERAAKAIAKFLLLRARDPIALRTNVPSIETLI